MEAKGFSIQNLSASFRYLCYGSTVTISFVSYLSEGSSLSESDAYRRSVASPLPLLFINKNPAVLNIIESYFLYQTEVDI